MDSASATPATVPDKLAKPTLRSLDRSLEVSWEAPEFDGGSPVTGYRVQFIQDSSSGTTGNGANWIYWPSSDPDGNPLMISETSRSTTIPPVLTNGLTYQVRVRASNGADHDPHGTGAGKGAWSETTSATPATVPGSPKNVVLTSRDGQIRVDWDKPDDDGGSDITDYDVHYKLSSASIWITTHDFTGTGTTTTITGLVNGSAYDVQVQAVNGANHSLSDSEDDNGHGPWTEHVSATPAGRPGPPQSVTLTAGNTEIAVSWAAPIDDGGSDITDYDVRYKLSSASIWITTHAFTGTGTSTTIEGLVNGSAYDVQVLASNAGTGTGTGTGTGPWTTTASATPAGPPGQPRSVTLTAGDTEIAVSWTAPSDDGGSAITDYDVRYKLNSATININTPWITTHDFTGTGTSTTLTGLVNGSAYDVQVRASNAGTGTGTGTGTGPWTTTASATPEGPPGPPQNVTLTAGDTEIAVSWTAPIDDGGSLIIDYDVHYKLSSAQIWITTHAFTGTGTSTTLTALVNGSAYDVRVRASNAGTGTGPWTAPVSATPS